MNVAFEISQINASSALWAVVTLIVFVSCLAFVIKKKSKTKAQVILVFVFSFLSLFHFAGTALNIRWHLSQYEVYKSGDYEVVEGEITSISIHGSKTLAIAIGSQTLIYDSVLGGCLGSNVRTYLREGHYYQIKYQPLDESICFYEILEKYN